MPAALALHTAGVPGIRSTFGTGSELLNSLRLLFSRAAHHRCPNGHVLEPSLRVAAGHDLVCPVCGVHFYAPSAEELAFNSQGACRTCSGTGIVRTVNEAALVPDESLTIDEGAVAPWGSLMWSLMTDVCRAMGVRTDVPFRELTEKERDIVYHGPAEKKHIFYKSKTTNQAGEMDFTYYNATYTVENALAKVKDEKGMKRVERFLKEGVCPDCGGTRLSARAREPKVRGLGLARGVPDAPFGSGGMGGWRATDTAGGNAAHGGEHLRFFCRGGGAASGSGTWLPVTGSSGVHPVHGRAAADGSWPVPCETAPRACCTCWMSLPSVCIRPILWD